MKTSLYTLLTIIGFLLLAITACSAPPEVETPLPVVENETEEPTTEPTFTLEPTVTNTPEPMLAPTPVPLDEAILGWWVVESAPDNTTGMRFFENGTASMLITESDEDEAYFVNMRWWIEEDNNTLVWQSGNVKANVRDIVDIEDNQLVIYREDNGIETTWVRHQASLNDLPEVTEDYLIGDWWEEGVDPEQAYMRYFPRGYAELIVIKNVDVISTDYDFLSDNAVRLKSREEDKTETILYIIKMADDSFTVTSMDGSETVWTKLPPLEKRLLGWWVNGDDLQNGWITLFSNGDVIMSFGESGIEQLRWSVEGDYLLQYFPGSSDSAIPPLRVFSAIPGRLTLFTEDDSIIVFNRHPDSFDVPALDADQIAGTWLFGEGEKTAESYTFNTDGTMQLFGMVDGTYEIVDNCIISKITVEGNPVVDVFFVADVTDDTLSGYPFSFPGGDSAKASFIRTE